jgi:hypothetical protein
VRVLELLDRSGDFWARGLALYAEGLRDQQPDVTSAFQHIGIAEQAERQAYALVRAAERRTAQTSVQP